MMTAMAAKRVWLFQRKSSNCWKKLASAGANRSLSERRGFSGGSAVQGGENASLVQNCFEQLLLEVRDCVSKQICTSAP